MSAVYPDDPICSVSPYDTPEGRQTFFAGLFPGLSFYSKLLKIVFNAGRIAKKGNYTPAEWVKGSLATLKALEDCGIKVQVRGAENILKPQGPCVFIGNHMSTLETFVLPSIIQPHREVTFVVKDSLMKYPYFKHVLAARDPIVVGRANPREDLAAVLEGGVQRLEGGTSIIVFPQSTRSHYFDERHFNTVGIKLARKAGVPVVPVALRTDAWGVGRLIKDAGPIDRALPVHFTFGEPITIQGNGKAEHAEICAFIKGQLEGWGVKSLPPGEEQKALAGGDSAAAASDTVQNAGRHAGQDAE